MKFLYGIIKNKNAIKNSDWKYLQICARKFHHRFGGNYELNYDNLCKLLHNWGHIEEARTKCQFA